MDEGISSARHEAAICYGEQDAFHEFKFRVGEVHSSSWEILALMQHYLIPTRLLDWTENLSFALQLALSKYFIALRANWLTGKTLNRWGLQVQRRSFLGTRC